MTKIEIDLGSLKETCFVIMPFISTFESEYNNIIRPAVEAAGLTCIRADEIYSKPQIMSDIWKSLRSSRIVIAELSGRNTNVFYEVGVAHTLGKPVIIITRNQDDVPFDLKALRYLYYDTNNPFWGQNLQKALTNMIKKLLKEEEYGTVFEGIKVGKIEYEEPSRKKISTPEKDKQLYNLTGSWKGEMKVFQTSYELSLDLVQEGSELSGTLIISYSHHKELTVVQEIVSGQIVQKTARIYGVSFTFLNQGAASDYVLDTLFAKISAKGNKMSGKCVDTDQNTGAFSLKKRSTVSEQPD